ncbi:hypothetical protein EVAR_24889_1 [Eumeta japonica]|uniref:Uncharacterized protein n=1 Tax=Eumeta variegata TaxID=151549 RepID=A0A4C1V8A7_EUMVA|nr:hypothetical protein EVAR_24889_1 [Eumeta japonica]
MIGCNKTAPSSVPLARAAPPAAEGDDATPNKMHSTYEEAGIVPHILREILMKLAHSPDACAKGVEIPRNGGDAQFLAYKCPKQCAINRMVMRSYRMCSRDFCRA